MLMSVVHLLYVLLLCFSDIQHSFTQVTYIKGKYNETRMDWDSASASCTLLGSNGDVSLENIRVNITGNSVEEAWIGAYTGYTYWIKIIGCYTVLTTDLANCPRIERTVNDLGTCVEFCGSYSVYALSDHSCFCIPVYPTFQRTCRMSVCEGTGNDFCGGPSGITTDVVFYEIIHDVQLSGLGNSRCVASVLFYGPFDYEYGYSELPCSTYVGDFACRTNDNPVTYNLFSGITNWTEAVIACSQSSYSIADVYKFNFQISTRLASGGHFWAGIYRKEYLQRSNVRENSPYITSLCMSAVVGQDGRLGTALKLCSDNLPFWCMPETEVTTNTNFLDTTVGETIVLENLNSDNQDATLLIIIVVMSLVFVAVVIGSIIYCRKIVAQKMLPGKPQTGKVSDARLSTSQLVLVDGIQSESSGQDNPDIQYENTDGHRPVSDAYYNLNNEKVTVQINETLHNEEESEYNCLEPDQEQYSQIKSDQPETEHIIYDEASNMRIPSGQSYDSVITEDAIYDQATVADRTENTYDQSHVTENIDDARHMYDHCPSSVDGGFYDHFEHVKRKMNKLPDVDDNYDHIPRTEL